MVHIPWRWLFAALAAPCLVPVGPAAAQGVDDLFTVYALPVDAVATTATEARDVALAQGQSAALRVILGRLTVAEDAGRLPAPKIHQIVEMVAAIEVENEKTSATRYLSELTVSFKKTPIRDLLRAATIPFTETRARPVLVLPVLQVGKSLRLFGEKNPWLEAWIAHEPPRGAMLPLLLPFGDLGDIAAIDAERAFAGDAGALSAIGELHEVETQLVATARFRGRPSGAAARALSVTLSWHGALRHGVEVRPFIPAGKESEAKMMARAVGAIAADLENAWKRETLVSFDEAFRLTAHVPLAGLADWLAIRAGLERNAMIERFDILAISKSGAQVELHYLGTPDRLRVSLSQDGLELTRDDAFWTLTPRTGASGRK